MPMIIEQPVFQKSALNLKGYSWIEQFFAIWKNPPTFILFEDWHLNLPDGTPIVIPRGFTTDFASTPRILWSFIEPDGPLCLGSIAHDFGYEYGYYLTLFDEKNTKYSADALKLRDQFPERYKIYVPIMLEEPEDYFDSYLKNITIETTGVTSQAEEAYIALKEFGHIAWNKYRKLGPTAYGYNSVGLPGRIISNEITKCCSCCSKHH